MSGKGRSIREKVENMNILSDCMGGTGTAMVLQCSQHIVRPLFYEATWAVQQEHCGGGSCVVCC